MDSCGMFKSMAEGEYEGKQVFLPHLSRLPGSSLTAVSFVVMNVDMNILSVSTQHIF